MFNPVTKWMHGVLMTGAILLAALPPLALVTGGFIA